MVETSARLLRMALAPLNLAGWECRACRTSRAPVHSWLEHALQADASHHVWAVECGVSTTWMEVPSWNHQHARGATCLQKKHAASAWHNGRVTMLRAPPLRLCTTLTRSKQSLDSKVLRYCFNGAVGHGSISQFSLENLLETSFTRSDSGYWAQSDPTLCFVQSLQAPGTLGTPQRGRIRATDARRHVGAKSVDVPHRLNCVFIPYAARVLSLQILVRDTVDHMKNESQTPVKPNPFDFNLVKGTFRKHQTEWCAAGNPQWKTTRAGLSPLVQLHCRLWTRHQAPQPDKGHDEALGNWVRHCYKKRVIAEETLKEVWRMFISSQPS